MKHVPNPQSLSDRELLEELWREVSKISVTLLGIPSTSDDGLVGNVHHLAKSLSELKRNFYLLVGFLMGSGALVGSIWAAMR